ncbi:hypothetical protein D3C87_1214430 [compost metagenome]
MRTSFGQVVRATRSGATINAGYTSSTKARSSSAQRVLELFPVPGEDHTAQRLLFTMKFEINSWYFRATKSVAMVSVPRRYHFGAVLVDVLGLSHDFKILGSVVPDIAVLMVNDFPR